MQGHESKSAEGSHLSDADGQEAKCASAPSKTIDKSRLRPSFYVASVLILMFVAWCVFYFFHWYYHMGNTRLLYERFAAIVGIPFAMCAAFVVVAILEQASGPIEVSVAGISIKGAAGQVLFWVIVFLAIVHAIAVLWPLTGITVGNSRLTKSV